MATFALYNFEFDICLPNDDEKDLFEKDSPLKLAKANFDKKQLILDEILQKDITNESSLSFTNRRNTISYIHEYLFEPKDGIYVILLKNNKKAQVHDEYLKSHKVDDYYGCKVIIDNSEGIQLIAIEDKQTAIGKLPTTAGVIERALNKALKSRYLRIRLENQYDSSSFWDIVNNKRDYPKGFQKVILKFQRKNLARLVNKKNKIARFFDETREQFDAEVIAEFNMPKGAGPMPLSEQNETQFECVEAAVDTGGPDSVILKPVGKAAIKIGQNNYITFTIPDYIYEGNNTNSPDIFTQPWEVIKSSIENASRRKPE